MSKEPRKFCVDCGIEISGFDGLLCEECEEMRLDDEQFEDEFFEEDDDWSDE